MSDPVTRLTTWLLGACVAFAAWGVVSVHSQAQGIEGLNASVSPPTIPANTPSPITFKITNHGKTLGKLTISNTMFELSIVDACQQNPIPQCKHLWMIPAGKSTLDWVPEPEGESGCQWTLQPQFGDTVEIEENHSVSFTLTGLIPKTGTTVNFCLSAQKLPGITDPEYFPLLSVTAAPPSATINSFTASPTIISSGTSTELAWDVTFPTRSDNTLTLNGEDVLSSSTQKTCVTNKENLCVSGCQMERPLSGSQSSYKYKLVASPGTVKQTVNVISSQPGWLPEGNPNGKRPTVLFGQATEGGPLFGIFVDEAGQTPTLWAIEDPVNQKWNSLGPLPKSMSQATPTACGAILIDTLYLIGGSTVLNGTYSNEVWSFPLSNKEENAWTQITSPAVPWMPRMGQTCVVYKDKTQTTDEIWMFGGYDQNSNPLNDVWTFDGGGWKQLTTPPWEPRGLVAATVYQNNLLIFGGFNGYEQKPYQDFWMYDGSEWEQQTITSHIPQALFAVNLQAIGNDAPYLSIAYADNSGDYSGRTQQLISDGNSSWHLFNRPDTSDPWDLPKPTYFSLQSVPFNGIIAYRPLAAKNQWPQQLTGTDKIFYFVPSALGTDEAETHHGRTRH